MNPSSAPHFDKTIPPKHYCGYCKTQLVGHSDLAFSQHLDACELVAVRKIQDERKKSQNN